MTHASSTPTVPGEPTIVPYEWARETRRCFPLFTDADVRDAYQHLLDMNDWEQRKFNAQVDSEQEVVT